MASNDRRACTVILSAALIVFFGSVAASAETPADPQIIEVTTWAMTLPDGEVVKYNAVSGENVGATFTHKALSTWYTFKGGFVDAETGMASFEIVRGRGSETHRTPVTNATLVDRQVEPTSRASVELEPGFEVRIEILEVRKVRAGATKPRLGCNVGTNIDKGGESCCVTCGSTTACGCGVCLNCGSCCNAGCYCPTC